MRPVILVVEDEELVGLFLRETLVDAGFDVHSLPNALPAMHLMDSTHICAAVIDVGLPDMAGDLLAEELQRQRPELPILLITGYDEEQCRTRFSNDPGVRILSKPFDGPALLQELKKLAITRQQEHASVLMHGIASRDCGSTDARRAVHAEAAPAAANS